MPNNYVLLDRIELNNTAASVTFDNIPQSGYTDLKVVVSARTDNNATFPWAGLRLAVNGLTTNQSFRAVYGNGSSASSGSGSVIESGLATSSLATANTFGNSELYIPNYTGNQQKSMSADSVQETNGTTALVGLQANLWAVTAAITSLTFTSQNSWNFVAGSTFSLYGLAQVGTTPVVAPKADGGNVIGTDGTYWYHAFLSNGTFTPQVGITADVLVVAGGGAGGSTVGGGGGAGGIFYATSQSLSTTNYTCTVGAGGSAGSADNRGNNGTNSQFGALTVGVGGGGGGAYNVGNRTGANGGSGGGAGNDNESSVSGGSSTQSSTGGTGYGNAGGSIVLFAQKGAGGGGAGAAGSNNSSTNGGPGGNGLNTWSTWASATGTGVSGYFAGGGGGGGTSGSTTAGGLGGGGVGGATSTDNATAGIVNTGGGGGGGANGGSLPGKAGGSGIIIIRYPVA